MKLAMSKFNPTTGEHHWIIKDENYDYNQEIARSAYADMLHDTERNKKYELGLAAAIKSMREQRRQCNVLDIGTGTGLLSMMAVRNGADTVHACDAFEPAAVCAEKIIAANGMAGKIKLIRKRSTDMSVPEDMAIRANILVTEVFDTELIGEGAIGTFTHALEHLLEPDCIVVPSAARMYIQPVESVYLSKLNQLSISLPDGIEPVDMPSNTDTYNTGLAAPLLDLQLSQLPTDLFTILAPPQIVFTFDFCGRKKLPLKSESELVFKALTEGTCHAFFMWWDIDMDMQGDILLSCAPYWQHPLPRHSMQWRDHWMQAIFYPLKPLRLEKDNEYTLESQHDEYSLSFDIRTVDSGCHLESKEHSPDVLHHCYTRSRLAMLQHKSYVSAYKKALNRMVDGNTVVLCASESSFLPYLLARMGVKKVIVVESGFVGSRRITQSIIDHNQLTDSIQIYNSYEDIPANVLQQVTSVVGEPYFSITSLPWDDIRFWYIRSTLLKTVTVCPKSARLMALAVQFDDLHKIRQPVGVCEGLDLNVYDQMIESARQISDDCIEPQSLWEYPGRALSQACTLLTFDLTTSLHDIDTQFLSTEGDISILSDGEYNGVALWMVYELDDGLHVSFGVKEDIEIGSYPNWNMERKQAVYLPRHSVAVTPQSSNLHFNAKYNLENGDMELSFHFLS